MQAAVHLLTFTELPARRSFAELVEIEDLDQWDDGSPIQAAWVSDWSALPGSSAAVRLSSCDQRMLALAVSLAAGEPVDLRGNVAIGAAHARRVIEAIATGYGEMYTITATAALDELGNRALAEAVDRQLTRRRRTS